MLRLAPTVSAVARQTMRVAFEDLEQTITPADWRDLRAISTLQQVRAAALEIENQLAARQALRNFRRLSPLLNGLEHYAKVADVLCNGTPYLPWLWAPITLVLRVASECVESLEQLMKGYSSIAESLARFKLLSSTDAFITNAEIQHTVAIFYADILQFHKHTYKFVRRSGWKLLFPTSWGQFQRRFDSILEDLDRHGNLMDLEANAHGTTNTREARQEVEMWREESLEQVRRAEEEQAAKQYQAIVSWLRIDEAEQLSIFDSIAEEAVKFPGTCGWILKNPKIHSWLQRKPDTPFIWLQGNPGSGKSVLSTQLMTFLGTTRYEHILRSILVQLLRNKAELVAHVYQEHVLGKKPASTTALERLLQALFPSISNEPRESQYVWIIVDALDECEPDKQARLLSLLNQLVPKTSSQANTVCKVLVSSRSSPALYKYLRKKQIVSLSDEASQLQGAIRLYVSQRLRSMGERFRQLDLGLADVEELERTIVKQSDGMFLYARILIDYLTTNIFYSGDELRESVQMLPRALSDLFNNKLAEIVAGLDARSVARVKFIFGLIAFSKRPLKKTELLSALSFSSGDLNVDSLAPQYALDICSPLIEERGDTTLTFIHASVKEVLHTPSDQLLIRKDDALREQGVASIACLLSGLDVFSSSFDERTRNRRLIKGLHGFHTYATEYWTECLLADAAMSGGPDLSSPLFMLASRLADRLEETLPPTISTQSSNFSPTDERLELLRSNELLYKHVDAALKGRSRYRLGSEILHDHDIDGVIKPSRELVDLDGISIMLDCYERSVKHINDQPSFPEVSAEELAFFKSQFSKSAYTCRLRCCPRATLGFESEVLRREHESSHVGFRCTVPGCIYSNTGSRVRTEGPKHDVLDMAIVSRCEIESSLGTANDDYQASSARRTYSTAFTTMSEQASIKKSRVEEGRIEEGGIEESGLEAPSTEDMQSPLNQNIVGAAEATDDGQSTLSADSLVLLSDEQKMIVIERFCGALSRKLHYEFVRPISTGVVPPAFRGSFYKLVKEYSKQVMEGTIRRSKTRQASKAIRMLRDQILIKFQDNLASREISTQSRIPFPSPNTLGEKTVEDKVTDWDISPLAAAPSLQSTNHFLFLDSFLFQDDDDLDAMSEFDAQIMSSTASEDDEVYAYLTEHGAFTNLIGNLQTEVEKHLCNQMELIRHRIFLALRRPGMFEKGSGGIFHASFRTEWDSAAFLDDQYPDGRSQDLRYVIVLIGGNTNAQLTTVEQYFSQNWPDHRSILIDQINSDWQRDRRSPSTGSNTVTFDGQTFHVSGSEDFVSTIGQQLAWLGAACRASTGELAHCHTMMTELPTPDDDVAGPAFEFSYEFSPVDQAEPAGCWHDLVGNSVLAVGYPIPLRDHGEFGLEIPLELMAALANVPLATQYGGGYILKGRSFAIVPVERTTVSVQWHFLKGQGNRMHLRDVHRLCPKRLSTEQLDEKTLLSTRCFLGWCADSRNHLATLHYPYHDVGYSKTRVSARGSPSVTGGSIGFQYFGTASLNFTMGKKDGVYHAKPSEFYRDLLDDLAQTHVVLHDMEDRRAWLTNAETLILHIILHRRALQPTKTDLLVSLTMAHADNPESVRQAMLSNEDIIIANDSHMTDTAMPGKSFKHVVHELSSLLEGLVAHANSANASGVELRFNRKTYLQGWEYMDLVNRKPNPRLRESDLKKTSGKWPELVRDMDALVLFGNRFREVIGPTGTARLCQTFKTLPKEKDYLAMEVSLFRRLCLESGSKEDEAQLTGTGLQLHISKDVFEPCGSPLKRSLSRDACCKCEKIQQIATKTCHANKERLQGFGTTGALIVGHVSTAWTDEVKRSLSNVATRNFQTTDSSVPVVAQGPHTQRTTSHDPELQGRIELQNASQHLPTATHALPAIQSEQDDDPAQLGNSQMIQWPTLAEPQSFPRPDWQAQTVGPQSIFDVIPHIPSLPDPTPQAPVDHASVRRGSPPARRRIRRVGRLDYRIRHPSTAISRTGGMTSPDRDSTEADFDDDSDTFSHPPSNFRASTSKRHGSSANMPPSGALPVHASLPSLSPTFIAANNRGQGSNYVSERAYRATGDDVIMTDVWNVPEALPSSGQRTATS